MPAIATKRLVAIALSGNLVAALGKIAAYAMTGSSALLSEAIHSLVAITHQILMLFGFEQAGRPGDARHAFGYAKEIYFWSFVVAVLLFSHGAGVAIYEGIQKLKSPPFLSIAPVSYAALLLALVVQIAVVVMLQRGRTSSNSPSLFSETRDAMRGALALETLAAVAGISVALAGLLATDVFAMRYGDAMASLGIGFVMATVAAVMCLRIRTLLLGAAADTALRSRLRVLFAAELGANRPLAAIHDIRTLQLGPDDILVAADVTFRAGESASSVEDATTRLDRSIKADAPEVSHVFLNLQHTGGAPGDGTIARSPAAGAPQPQQSAVSPPRPPAPSPEGNRKSRKKNRRH